MYMFVNATLFKLLINVMISLFCIACVNMHRTLKYINRLSVTNAYLYNIMIYYYYIIFIIAFHYISFYYHFIYLQIYVSLCTSSHQRFFFSLHHHIIIHFSLLFHISLILHNPFDFQLTI